MLLQSYPYQNNNNNKTITKEKNMHIMLVNRLTNIQLGSSRFNSNKNFVVSVSSDIYKSLISIFMWMQFAASAGNFLLNLHPCSIHLALTNTEISSNIQLIVILLLLFIFIFAITFIGCCIYILRWSQCIMHIL